MSTEPDEELVYLSFDEALEIYGAIIGRTARQAADQLRSRDALEGSIPSPRCGWKCAVSKAMSCSSATSMAFAIAPSGYDFVHATCGGCRFP